MDVVVDEVEGSIPCDMCTQGGGASTEKICRWPDAFVPGQYVTNRIDIKEENEPADKAEVPIALSSVRMNVVGGSHENREDVSCAFHATLRVHGLCRVSNKKVGGLACTYLTVCITECLGLLIHSIRIDRILVVNIGGVGLCGLIFLMVQGSMARAARRFASCLFAWFALEGHDVVRIDGLGRRARSTSRSMCGRRSFGDKGVKHGCGNLALALGRRESHCWGHGLIIVRVIEPDNLRRIQEFAIRAYSTIVRCHGKLRIWKARASLCTFYYTCKEDTKHMPRIVPHGKGEKPRSSTGTAEQVRMGGESTENTYEEGWEWTLDDPVMKRAKRTRTPSGTSSCIPSSKSYWIWKLCTHNAND